MFGSHAENLEVAKDGIKLVGVGATLTPPATPRPNVCADPTNPDDVNGICLHGDITQGPDGTVVNTYLQGASVSGFTVQNFPATGIFAIGTMGTRLVANKTLDDGEYGIFSNTSSGTTIVGNVATNGQEAGIYVGDSPEANATVVGNDSSGSGWGIFVRNAEHGTIVGNRLHDNCVGILFLADSPGPTGSFNVTGNIIQHNSKACPPGDDGTPPVSGVGIAIAGAHDVTTRGNVITNNTPGGPTAFSGGVAIFSIGPTPPMDNLVRGNLILGNQPDLFWDGSGTGNVFVANLFKTKNF